MKIQTDFEVPANVNVVWDMLDDPSVIEASIPGIQSMEQIGPDHYRIVMRVGIGMIRGDFKRRDQGNREGSSGNASLVY